MARSSAVFAAMFLLACADSEQPKDANSLRAGGLPADLRDVGSRAPTTRPVIVVPGACAAPFVCSVADANGDRKADLVRRWPGKGVQVAQSNGWSFGPFQTVGPCPSGSICTLADLDGSSSAEVLNIDASSGSLIAQSVSFDGISGTPFAVPGTGACTHGASSCRSFDLDGDLSSEIGWVEPDGDLVIADPGAAKGGAIIPGACASGRVCNLFEMDGEPGADLVVWGGDIAGALVYPLSSGGYLKLTADCNAGGCSVADIDGDGRGDFLHWDAGEVQVWSSQDAWSHPLELGWGNVWNPYETSLWADANDDGYDDLFRIDDEGNVSLHLNVDARGRLQAVALELTTLDRQQARALRQQLLSEDGADAPMDAAAYEAARAPLVVEMEQAIATLMAAIPAEAAIETDEDVRQINALSMMAAVGRAIVAAGPLGASTRGTGCANAVVQSVGVEDGAVRQSPSYLFAFAEGLTDPDPDTRTPALIDALTATTAGFRCLNNDELHRLDAAFANAVLQTADELHAEGHRMAPKWLVDNALPIVLLTFDAVKYNAVPQSYRLLSSQFGDSVQPGALPTPEFDFASAAADPDCTSFLCQTYGNPRRVDPAGRGLMLDQLGIWLSDPARSGRLAGIDVDPRQLLESLLDLRNLGEGDCSLFEVVNTNFMCRSQRTCDAAAGVDGAGLDALGDALAPGASGSELSHLLTPREDLGAHNGCGSEDEVGAGAGGPGAAACVGPALGSRQGRFSADPELDNIFRCAIEAGAAPIDVAVDLGDFCLSGQDEQLDAPPPQTEPEDESGELSAEQQAAFEAARTKAATALRNSELEATRRLAESFVREYGTSENGLTVEKVLEAFQQAADVIEGAVVADLVGAFGVAAEDLVDGKLFVVVDVVRSANALSGTDDLETFLGYVLVHEGVHIASKILYRSHRIGRGEFRDHIVTRHNDLGQQCADGPCESSCGAGDSVFGRFAECVDATPDGVSPGDLSCVYAEDVCDDRRLGEMGFPMDDDCTPELPVTATDPECYVVQCGSDFSALANACCASESAPETLPPLERVIGPGPRPPRPMLERFFTDLGGFAADFGAGGL